MRGRASAPELSCASTVGRRRCFLIAVGFLSGLVRTGTSPASASASCALSVANHFMNVIALSLLGADAETPWMKIPICAIALTCFGTVPKSSLPTSLDTLGSSEEIALPVYWMIAPASPPRIAAPSWVESYSATPEGASDLSLPTKKSAAALPCGLLNVTFHLLSKNVPPKLRKIGYHDVTIGLPLTPRKT